MDEVSDLVSPGLVSDGTADPYLDLGTIGVSTPPSLGDCHTKAKTWEGVNDTPWFSALKCPHDCGHDGFHLYYPRDFVGEILELNNFI